MNRTTEIRLEELESRMAFQDDVIENLNQVVARQDREIQHMRQEIAELKTRLRDLDNAAAHAGSPPGFEIPPHY